MVNKYTICINFFHFYPVNCNKLLDIKYNNVCKCNNRCKSYQKCGINIRLCNPYIICSRNESLTKYPHAATAIIPEANVV